jgi:hypothetical protein
MRKSIAVLMLLFAFPLVAAPSPKQRELAQTLLALVDVSLVDALADHNRDVLKPAEVQAAIRAALVDVYASRFSESELAELIAFYGTPTGKKLAHLSPELQKESAEKAQAALEPLLERERDRTSPWVGTMASMRLLAEALEKYAAANQQYPEMSLSALKRALVPEYLKEVPEKDSWGNDFYYTTTRFGRHYRIVSAGSDGIFDEGSMEIPGEGDQYETTELVDDLKIDIIYANGAFMRLPRIAAEPE